MSVNVRERGECQNRSGRVRIRGRPGGRQQELFYRNEAKCLDEDRRQQPHRKCSHPPYPVQEKTHRNNTPDQLAYQCKHPSSLLTLPRPALTVRSSPSPCRRQSAGRPCRSVGRREDCRPADRASAGAAPRPPGAAWGPPRREPAAETPAGSRRRPRSGEEGETGGRVQDPSDS